MSGLRVWRDVTVGFDITGLTELLSCPLPVADSYNDGLPELFEDDVRKNSTEIRALTRESSWNIWPAEALVEVKKLEEEEKKQQKVLGEVQSYFQQAHEVLLVDGAKYDKEAGADEEPGEVLIEVPPQDAPANGHAVEAVEWGLH
ncbi:hypothetical protein IWW34DRAFT_805068 [Fusarium oxysporum f. sp. albedinis]|nr:hypothetical protein IWW34DRAFT_805068 [Fusarium oxysporum f. sp. albedinis]